MTKERYEGRGSKIRTRMMTTKGRKEMNLSLFLRKRVSTTTSSLLEVSTFLSLLVSDVHHFLFPAVDLQFLVDSFFSLLQPCFPSCLFNPLSFSFFSHLPPSSLINTLDIWTSFISLRSRLSCVRRFNKIHTVSRHKTVYTS